MAQDDIYRDTRENPEEIAVEAKPIAPSSTSTPQKKQEVSENEYYTCTCFQNVLQNSRCANQLPEAQWHSGNKKEIYPDFNPKYILFIPNSVYIRGDMLWMLLDAKGNNISTSVGGSGERAYISHETKTLIQSEPGGKISIRTLSNGESTATFNAKFGSSIAHAFFYTLGKKLFFAGSKLPAPGVQSDSQDLLSILERADIPSGDKSSRDLLLEDEIESKPKPVLFDSPHICVAGFENNVIVAEENRILFFDTSLKVVNLIKGEFEPITMSVDEACRMHLIVSVEGKFELWIVNREGGRECTIPLFKPFDKTEIPPIIGFDHTVYLIAENRIMAARPDGEILWVLPAKNTIKGAIITQGDKLLVTEEKEVVYYSLEAERNELFAVEDELICTPPVLSPDGKMSFATDKHLYCIEAITNEKDLKQIL